MGIIGFMDICANARGRSFKLIDKRIMSLNIFTKSDCFYGKIHGKINELIFLQSIHLCKKLFMKYRCAI